MGEEVNSYPYWIEFLDELMCYSNSDNNLECSVWITLTSTEYIAIMQGISIIKFTISHQIQYLVGKTY